VPRATDRSDRATSVARHSIEFLPGNGSVTPQQAPKPLRVKSNFFSNLKLIGLSVQQAKIFHLPFPKIRIIAIPVSCPPEGRIAIVTTRWARDAMDAAVQRRMFCCVRSSRVVLAPRMLAKSSWEAILSGATVTTSSLHRGEHEVSRKAIAQGMSVCSPLTCMLVCRHSCALWHMRPRVQRAPGIPCALSLQERDNEIGKTRANHAARTGTYVPSSLRANGSRECAPDDRLREAIHLSACRAMDCFVARAPRNDG
jgi:hypothetical protein